MLEFEYYGEDMYDIAGAAAQVGMSSMLTAYGGDRLLVPRWQANIAMGGTRS